MEWVTNLLNKTEMNPDIITILEIFLNFMEDDVISSSDNQERFWAFVTEYLTSKLDNISKLFHEFNFLIQLNR